MMEFKKTKDIQIVVKRIKRIKHYSETLNYYCYF